MTRLDPAAWQAILDHLKKRHAAICRQWFEKLEPLGIDAGLLHIQTQTAIQRNYLQKQHCLEAFNEAAQAATGHLVSVQFTDVQAPPKPVLAHDPNHPGDPGANGQTSGQSNGQVNGQPAKPRKPLVVPTIRANDLADFDEDQMVLSPDYSFDTFIQGRNNQLAYAAAVAVSNQPGDAYNPLFIHGGVGLGKTHLLQAICQKVLEQSPETRILYVSCDAFINQFINCVQSGQMSAFRHRYRHVDLLVIDDIHFLSNRDRTQEEFFHTFNELYQSRRQIVLSSDAAPSEIPQLEERLVSRFHWGLVAPVTKPSYETRVAIIRAKVKLRGMQIDDDVVQLIARRSDTNARELEGAITAVLGRASLLGQTVNVALAREVLGEPAAAPRANQATLQQIIEKVTGFYGVKLSDLQSRRRHKSVTEPRQVCMWIARRQTRFSLEEIGGYFGGRDHTTVMHSIRTVEARSTADPEFAQVVKQLDDQVREPALSPSS
ncbi:MAG: chromosomal replication initiator protein DnaA [Planctomycetota bacterium]